MTKPKKPEPNPIEEAIGARAKDPKAHEKFTKEYQTEPISPIPQTPEQIPDEPSPQEMVDLEELNRQTEERLLNNDRILDEKLTQEEKRILNQKKPTIPVSKPDLQPATETSSRESQPPQNPKSNPDDDFVKEISELPQDTESDGRSDKAFEITKNVKKTNEQTLQEVNSGIDVSEIDEYSDAEKGLQFELKEKLPVRGCSLNIPAEDKELTALKKYILEDGFVVSGVAMHIVMLCGQPLVTPSTTTWAFVDRANIPDMVLAILRTPAYLDGIWPSLKIIMGTNKGNTAWTAGIATTIAFFDCIRTLPALDELKNDK